MSDVKMMDSGVGPGWPTTTDVEQHGARTVYLDRPVRPARRQWAQPSWKVPKWQYNKLKQHILKSQKTKTRAPYQRRNYNAGGGYRGSSGGAMGPIVITGRGGYFGDKLRSAASAGWRSFGRIAPEGMWNRLGTAAGGAMFGAPGATIGGSLGSGIANALGFGSYTVRSNALMKLDEGMQVPTFEDLNQGVVVSHREYIGDIVQSTTFLNRAYAINPGDQTTFPWLNTIATNFEQYEILGLIFHYRSTASDFGTTSNMAMGTVIMATEYDSVDTNYASELEMQNSQYSMSGKPSCDIIHPVECDPSVVGPMGLKYVRTGPVPSGKDNRLYDHGTFQLATSGMPASTGTVGQLWVTYKIAFYKPQFGLGESIRSAYFNGVPSGAGRLPTVANTFNSLALTGLSGAVSTFGFPANVAVGTRWLIVYWVQGATTGGQLAGSLTLVGAQNLIFRSAPEAATSTDRIEWSCLLQITAPLATVTCANTMPGSVAQCELYVTQWDKEV